MRTLGVTACTLVLFATWSWPWWASILAVLVAGVVVIPIGHALTIFEEVPS